MLNSKKYTVQICGETYVIVSAEPTDKIELSVANVDALMRNINDGTVSTSLKKSAILTALRLSLEIQSLKEELSQTQQAVQRIITQLEIP